MEKILLTGGRGFFCSRFADYYRGKFELLITGRHNLDITDAGQVMQVVTEFKPDYVIHAAAIAVTDFCNKNPEIAHRTNVEGAVNVAKACKAVDAKLLFISTEQVFNGNAESGPYDENQLPVPDTVYGQNKLEAEGLLREMLDTLWIARFTWLFGLPQRGCGMAANILWDTVTAILRGEKIVASPNEFRGMTYVFDMIENIMKLFQKPYGTYHLGAANSMSRYETVREIFLAMGLESRMDALLVKDEEKYAQHPRDVRLCTDKAARVGIEFPDTKTAIHTCIKEFGLTL